VLGGSGSGNYSAVDAGSFGYALAFAVLPLAAILVVAPLLAYTAHLAGRHARLAVRLGLAVPMVCLTPAVIALASLVGFWQDVPEGPRAIGVAGLSTFGLACGLATTAYLAVLRRGGPTRASVATGAAVAGIGALATVAVALQMFAYPAGMLGRDTPVMDIYENGLRLLDVGGGSAVSTVLGVLLGLLGLGAAAVIIRTGLRVEADRTAEAAVRPRPPALAATAAVLLVVLAVSLFGLWPWLRPLLASGLPDGDNIGRILVNTWLPPLITTVAGVALAALAGFAIGALRPLGRRSPLLLLPFAPWLFTGVGPLLLASVPATWSEGLVGGFLSLIPPGELSVPALFVFAVFFRGQAERWTELTAGRGVGAAIVGTWLPALPLVGLVGGATWLARAQDITWTFSVPYSDEVATGPLSATTSGWMLDYAPEVVVRNGLPLVAVVLFAAALAAVQVWYLDNLTIRTGPETD
jgi:hypothetical protein